VEQDRVQARACLLQLERLELVDMGSDSAGVVIDNGDLLPIPSFYFLDADKNVLGNVALADDGALDKSLELMAELGTR